MYIQQNAEGISSDLIQAIERQKSLPQMMGPSNYNQRQRKLNTIAAIANTSACMRVGKIMLSY